MSEQEEPTLTAHAVFIAGVDVVVELEELAKLLLVPVKGGKMPQPTHKSTLILPHDRREFIVSETVPTGKIKGSGYCKYCYQSHRNWWMMDQRDYKCEGLTIVLCGECEHTSAVEFTDLPAELARPWRSDV